MIKWVLAGRRLGRERRGIVKRRRLLRRRWYGELDSVRPAEGFAASLAQPSTASSISLAVTFNQSRRM
ncbi:hypothetical protein HYQ46_012706 [Verticillium longisporum]|nr:hypothetical protein HYQ46_012706 [Verticillium longisporum]